MSVKPYLLAVRASEYLAAFFVGGVSARVRFKRNVDCTRRIDHICCNSYSFFP
jgi:hypothetical protein